MQLFYSKEIEKFQTLNKEESQHCQKVLRKKKNDNIFVTDGLGNFYECKIKEEIKNELKVEILNKKKTKKKPIIELAISFPKQRIRSEWIIEKATEIGVNIITPIVCEKSERIKINYDRMNKIAISSMKQSLRTYLPIISKMQKFSEFIKKSNLDQKFIAHCKYDSSKEKIKNNKKKSSCILIGPEGDFSNKEIILAKKFQFKTVTLNDNRLRTETAAIIACNQLISL